MRPKGTLVFASGKQTDFDIWTLNIESKELHQLTTGSAWNDAPRWSPDGSKIVFVSNRSGVPELWTMGADGSNQRQLTESGKFHSEPCWSPDGKSIACAANYEDGENIDIYIFSSDGSGSPRRVTTNIGVEAGPSWSPCGGCLLYSSSREGNEDIYELDLKTGSERRVTSHPARDFHPAYSPDGSQIAFVTEADENSRTDGSADADVWVMSRDGSTEKRLTANAGCDRYVSWSPDGRFIVCCADGKGTGGTDRLNIIRVDTAVQIDFSYDRSQMEKEINAELKDHWLWGMLPEFVQRKAYPEYYFGCEHYPDWKS